VQLSGIKALCSRVQQKLNLEDKKKASLQQTSTFTGSKQNHKATKDFKGTVICGQIKPIGPILQKQAIKVAAL